MKSSEPVIHSTIPSKLNSENFVIEKTEKDLSVDNEDSSDIISNTVKSLAEIPVNQVKQCSTYAVSQEENLTSNKTFVDQAVLNINQDVTKTHPLHLYPDLKQLQHCEKVHSILSSQTLVRTCVEKFQNKTAIEANNCFKDFIKVSM